MKKPKPKKDIFDTLTNKKIEIKATPVILKREKNIDAEPVVIKKVKETAESILEAIKQKKKLNSLNGNRFEHEFKKSVLDLWFSSSASDRNYGNINEFCNQHKVTPRTLYRWQKEHLNEIIASSEQVINSGKKLTKAQLEKLKIINTLFSADRPKIIGKTPDKKVIKNGRK